MRRTLATALFVALMLAIFFSPAYADKLKPTPTATPTATATQTNSTITVMVPLKASHTEVMERVRAAAPQNMVVRIHIQESSNVQPLAPKAAVAAVQATQPITTVLAWNRPANSNYATASKSDLNPTLSYSSTETVVLEAFSWVQYRDINDPSWDSYEDFDYFSGRISGAGSLMMHLPQFRAIPGRAQEARFDATIRFDGDPYNIMNSASAVFSMGQVFLPNVSR